MYNRVPQTLLVGDADLSQADFGIMTESSSSSNQSIMQVNSVAAGLE